jgi:hypothetical protein
VKFLHHFRFRQAVLAAAALLLGAIGQVRADILVDDFSSPNPAVSYSLAAPVGSNFVRVDGNRTVTVTQTQNSFAAAGFTTGLIGNSALGPRMNLNTGVNTTAFASLSYSFAGGLNLSTAGSLLDVTVNSTDLNVPFSVILTDGTNTSTQVGIITSPTSQLSVAAFSGVNLNAITSIQLVLNQNVLTSASTESADFSISRVNIVQPASSVPAPPAVLLALAALPVLGLRRKFAKA